MQEAEDLRAEGVELNALLDELTADDWRRATPFKNWRVWDVVAHLHLSDLWALAALDSREVLQAELAPVFAALSAGRSLIEFTRERFEAVTARELQVTWRATLNALCERASRLDREARIPWVGPDMDAPTFFAARLMETWAHGQDIYDLLGRERVYSDRIHAIATLGVKTYGFTFANRGLTPPTPKPYVRLTAPSGAVWVFNEACEAHRVEGLASEFCHVVTQGRNIAETGLRVTGASAEQWMAIAQCFAGPPEDPPPPGSRVPT